MTKKGATLLDGVTATGAGTAETGLEQCTNLTFFIIATSVTTGGTVAIEVSPDGTNWFTAHSETVAATGNIGPIYMPGRCDQVRANVTARTDGTYTVKMLAN